MSTKTKHQSFTAIIVGRGELKGAPYNPRKIDDEARARLKRRLKEDGLLAPVVFNRITGHVVSGHQRLSILDDLEGRADYRLTVAAVDLTADKEKRVNILLNNREAQGKWDNEKLAQLIEGLKEDEIDWLGFEEGEIGLAFDAGEMPGLHDRETPEANADKATIAEMKEARAKFKEDSAVRYDDEFYCVLVFASAEMKERFCTSIGRGKGERFIPGKALEKTP